jgi:hypothetical protein
MRVSVLLSVFQRGGGEAERRHRTGRERMGSPTLQALKEPVLLPPWLCFRGGDFLSFPNQLTLVRVHATRTSHVSVERDIGLVGVEAAERLRRRVLHLQYTHRRVARQCRPHLSPYPAPQRSHSLKKISPAPPTF